MCLYIINRCESRLRVFGKGVSGVFDTCDAGINTLKVGEVLLIERDDLLLEIYGILDNFTSLRRWISDLAWTVFVRFSARYAANESRIFVFSSSAD